MLPRVEPAPRCRPRGVYARWWFWTIIGGGGVGGAVAAIAVAASGTTLPHGTLTTVDAR